VGGGVFAHLRGEIEPLTVFACEGQAQHSAAVAEHEVDDFRRDGLGGANEVALVFPAFVIDDDDDVALAELGDGFFSCAER